MPSVNTLKKMSAASGLVFGIFLAMHLFAHYMLNLGYEQAQETMLAFRVIYQHPIFELSLAASLGVHMYSNTCLYLNRSKINAQVKKETDGKKPAGSAELTAHRIAGYILSLSIFGHVFATRLGAFIMLPDSSVYDYGFVASVFEVVPFNLFPIYLCIFGMAGGWHLVYGTRSAIAILTGSSVVGKPVPVPLKVVAMINHVAIVAGMVALGKYLTTIDMSDKEDVRTKFFADLGLH